MKPKPKQNFSARQLREAMHDELGPRLFSAAARLSLLKGELAGRQRKQAAVILGELEETREQVRRLQRGISEPAMGDLGQALERLAAKFGGRFQNDLLRPIKGETAELLFRIAREAAQNAAQHGRASEVAIRLSPGLLEVRDNGTGLAKGWREGTGMQLMRARARRLEGRLSVQRVAGGGTVLACYFASGM
jgi:signal transduction histidine kinase